MAYDVVRQQAERLSASHTVVYIRAGPDGLGFPHSRNRTLSADLNKKTMVWTGPEKPAEICADFFRLFQRRCVLDGSAYFHASNAEVNAHASARASKSKRSLPVDFETMPMQEYVHCMLSPGTLARFQIYLEQAARRSNMVDDFLFDVGKTDGYNYTGRLVPNLQCSGQVYSTLKKRLMLPMERLACQGLDMYSELSGGRSLSPWYQILSQRSDCNLTQMSGNALHIPLFTMWMMYVFGNTVWRTDYYAIDRRFEKSQEQEESDDD